MSTWTSKAVLALAALGVMSLGACVAPDGSTGPSFAALTAALRKRQVLDGALTLSPPQGYCIDPGGVTEQDDSAIALMGRCATAPTRAKAVLTAAIAPAGTGFDVASSGQELAAFFSSREGRAALSQGGSARSVTVHQAIGAEEVFLLRFTDQSLSDESVPMQPERWRAVMVLRGRLVTLTVGGTVKAPLTTEDGRNLLDAFITAMKTANRDRAG